jgi:hypothetical protein
LDELLRYVLSFLQDQSSGNKRHAALRCLCSLSESTGFVIGTIFFFTGRHFVFLEKVQFYEFWVCLEKKFQFCKF